MLGTRGGKDRNHKYITVNVHLSLLSWISFASEVKCQMLIDTKLEINFIQIVLRI